MSSPAKGDYRPPAPDAVALMSWVQLFDVDLGDLEGAMERLAERVSAKVAASGPDREIGRVLAGLEDRIMAVTRELSRAARLLG